MCGRYTETAAFEQLAQRFGITVEEADDEDIIARYNVAPSPIVVARSGDRALVMARWGFHPAWMTGKTVAPINAKAEAVGTNRMFEGALRHEDSMGNGSVIRLPPLGDRRPSGLWLYSRASDALSRKAMTLFVRRSEDESGSRTADR